MGGDQLCVTQPQGLEDVFLLTEEVLLVVVLSIIEGSSLLDPSDNLIAQLLLPLFARLFR